MLRARYFIAVAFIVSIGCTQRAAPPVTVNATHPIKNRKADTPQPVRAETDKDDEPATPSNAEAVPSETPSSTDSEGPGPESPPPHVERFLLMAQGGPVLVEATLTLDGRPLRDAMSHLVDALLADADIDGDGRPTWDEVVNSPEFKGGRYGNVEADTATEAARMVQLYDVNKNGVVDRGEVPRFLTRNAGGSRPFSLTSSNEFRGYNQFDSPTLRFLDRTRDGRLDAEEIAGATVRLRARDADVDDILVAADLANSSLDASPGQMSNRRRAAPDAAYLLNDQTQWDSLLYSLCELYAYGGDLDAGSFPHRPALFEKLDRDADGGVDRDEIQQLAELPPHIRLEAHFGTRPDSTDSTDAEDGYPGPRLKLTSLAEELQADPSTIAESDVRVSLEIPGTELVFFANDAAGVNYEAQAQGQITTYDANSDGYLEADELPNGLPGVAASFEVLDGDNDGKLHLDELTEYLRQRAGAALSQIRARAADEPDALFAALDDDNDGRLETRELDRAAEMLRSLDADDDGILASHELPGVMAVGFVRGDPQQANSLYVVPTVPNLAGEDVPAWFRPMDFNGDGEISAGEFLGQIEQFTDLDADGDGFLSAGEAGQTRVE
ncbi:MAG: hypothetical protein KY475_07570 [Planctomycetes bacterium]|nr:hypothetical protein [Planctomycetota bacterium]